MDLGPVVRVRDRGWNIPTAEKIELIFDPEQKFRSGLLLDLQKDLFNYWNDFSAEHFGGAKVEWRDEKWVLSEFIARYAYFLYLFKEARKSKGNISHYFHSIRIMSYDRTFKMWRQIGRLNDQLEMPSEEFYRHFKVLVFDVGMVCRGLELISRSQMNLGEYIISNIDSRSRGGKTRHLNDPKFQDKALVYECWQNWQSNPSAYRGPTAFAKDMLEKVANLSSDTQVIMRWVREWKSGKTGP